MKADIKLKSDPICGTGGCVAFPNPNAKKPEYPMNYAVPDFGVDEDIKASQSHEKDAIAGRWSVGGAEATVTEAPGTATSLATLADVHM